jgi:hypothetical protein
VTEIHRRAAEFYGARDGVTARAEALYHRLMKGDDPRSLDPLWNPALLPDLLPAIDEPMPKRSRIWWERRVGLAPAEDGAEWEQEDWEASAWTRARSWLVSRLPREALAVLDERPDRLPGSRLPALEVAAAIGVGDLDRAADVLQRGMRAAQRHADRAAQLDLAEQAIVLHTRRDDAAGVAEAARAAVAVSDLTGEPVRAIEALLRAVRFLDGSGDVGRSATLAGDLSVRFGRLSVPSIRQYPGLVRRVLHGVGATEPSVLLHAAAHTGDLTADGGVFVADVRALAQLLDATSPDALPAIQALGREVGIVDGRWDPIDLAARAVRTGRVGAVIRVGLDYASDGGAACALVAEELVQPIDEEDDHGVPLSG